MAAERSAYEQIWDLERSQLIASNRQRTQELRARVLDEDVRRKIFPEFLNKVVPVLVKIAHEEPQIAELPDIQKEIRSGFASGYHYPQVAGAVSLNWGPKIGATEEEIAKIVRYRKLGRELKKRDLKRRDFRKLQDDMKRLGDEVLVIDDFNSIIVSLYKKELKGPYRIKVFGDTNQENLIPFAEGFEEKITEVLTYTLKNPETIKISGPIRLLVPLISKKSRPIFSQQHTIPI